MRIAGKQINWLDSHKQWTRERGLVMSINAIRSNSSPTAKVTKKPMICRFIRAAVRPLPIRQQWCRRRSLRRGVGPGGVPVRSNLVEQADRQRLTNSLGSVFGRACCR
jgi:hypothetical protein